MSKKVIYSIGHGTRKIEEIDLIVMKVEEIASNDSKQTGGGPS